jgi:hypothetical protein
LQAPEGLLTTRCSGLATLAAELDIVMRPDKGHRAFCRSVRQVPHRSGSPGGGDNRVPGHAAFRFARESERLFST